MSVTLTDLSEAVGLSTSAVSKAINGRGDVSTQTRARVLRAARQMKYPLTGQRKGRRVNTPIQHRLGLVCFELSREALMQEGPKRFLLGAEEAIATFGGELVLEFHPKGKPRCCREGNINGLIVFGRPTKKDLSLLDGIPAVCCPGHGEDSGILSVVQDNLSGAQQATQTLIDHGHRRIGFVSHHASVRCFLERSAGYLMTMTQAGLTPTLITDPRSAAEATDDLVDKMLKENFTAIFAGNDGLAKRIITRLTQQGIRVPEDVSIVGYDHSRYSDWPGPQLTTIDNHIEKAAALAVQLLINPFDASPQKDFRLVVSQTLIEGQTVASPRHNG